MTYWNDITPDMMSEEDRVEDKYIRHPPCYRSGSVQKFVDKLDSRLQKRGPERARIVRVLGSPRICRAPPKAKEWTVQCARRTSSNNSNTTVDQEQEEPVPNQASGCSSDSEFSADSSSEASTVY